MDDRLLPHPIRRQSRLTVKKATKRKILTREVRFCVGSKIVKKKKNRRASFGIFPCVAVTSLKKDAHMATNAIFVMLRRRRSPASSQRKVVQRISCHGDGVDTIGLCISRFFSEKDYST